MIRFVDLCNTRSSGRSIAPAGPARPAAGRIRLLASVRSEAEAEAAIDAGADVLDLKEPRRGPLGPCNPATLRSVAALRDRRSSRLPLSAAIGPAIGPRASRLAALAADLGYDAVKTGLEGVAAAARAGVALAKIAPAGPGAPSGHLWVAGGYAEAAPGGAVSPPLP